MYPERGMPDNEKYRRRGADPPRNESGTGMTDSVSTCDESHRSVSSGNDTCIGAKTSSNYQSARPRRMTSHTRLLCPYCPQRREARLARYPVCPLRMFWVYNKVADSGNVVTEKQGFSIVGTHQSGADIAGCCTTKDIRRLWLGCIFQVRQQFFAVSRPSEWRSIRNRYPGKARK
jgi:hypothetical protein